jgi:CheY-like chemotaxis protein
MWLLTGAGREAWQSQDTAVPEAYRRLLWLIDVQGDTHAIKTLLGDHPEELVRDWLHELEELRFIESRPRTGDVDRTIPMTLDAPALRAGAEAAAALSGAGAYLASNRPRGARAPKAPAETTLLIAEDDPDQLALADLRVSAAGYQVRTAASVAELTRSLLRDGAPDLLLLDVMLPDGNGLNVLARLRQHPAFASLPIILLTVINDPAHVAKGLALGADGYVTKPYSKNILVGVIHGVLG